MELERGDSVKYRVRGLYYVLDEDEDGYKKLRVISVGSWSDYYTYKIPAEVKEINVTGLKGEVYVDDYDAKKVKFSWNPVPEASSYNMQYIRSSVKLTGLTEENWSEFYDKKALLMMRLKQQIRMLHLIRGQAMCIIFIIVWLLVQRTRTIMCV